MWQYFHGKMGKYLCLQKQQLNQHLIISNSSFDKDVNISEKVYRINQKHLTEHWEKYKTETMKKCSGNNRLFYNQSGD